MWNLKACLVCLSTDVKLFSLNSGTLRYDFNLVSGLKVVQGNGMPEYLCVECSALVMKYKAFRHKCHRAHYALSQIIIKNKEIKKSNLTYIDRKKLKIMPTLSYMTLDKTNYSQFQFEMVDHFRKGNILMDHIPVAHCSTLTPEQTFEFEMKNVTTKDLKTAIVKIEPSGQDAVNEQNFNQIQNQNIPIASTTMPNSTNDDLLNDLYVNGDEFDTNMNFEESDAEDDDKFEAVSCTLDSKAVNHTADCADVVPMSVKEAKAVVEVNKYTSKGPHQCHCGKAFVVEKNFKTHCRRHDLHISGTHHCEICDYYFKTAFLLQCHMSDQHMYKYLCKMCPEVSFTKSSAKQHYSSHVKPDSGSPTDKAVTKKPSWITPTNRGGVRTKGICKVKPKRTTRKKLPTDFPAYSPQTPLEQYEMVQRRRQSRNYLEAKYKCDLCFRGYRLTSTYNKHMAKHDSTVSGTHQCDMCKHYFRDTRRLYKHMISYHLFKYACRICDYVTTNKGQAIYHYRWHKNVTYDCPHCDKKFSKITTQMTHIRFKHPGTDICNICGHSFISSSGLKYHKLVAHSKEEIEESESIIARPDPASPHHCPECRLQFLTEEAYVTHLGSSKKHVEVNLSSQSVMKGKSRAGRQETGPDGRESIPPARRRRVADSQVLNTGVSTATHCNVCGVFLVNDVEARRHYEAEHPGTEYLKRYMCDVCGHTTKQFANLLVHMRTHTREKPYPCPHCDRRFSMTSNRDRHLVVHTGEKRFQCQHCSRRFTQSTAVKLHIQTVHMKIPYKPWDKKNRKRRKEAQQLSLAAGTEVVETAEPIVAPAPVPQHKLLIDPQGEYITYVYTHTQQ